MKPEGLQHLFRRLSGYERYERYERCTKLLKFGGLSGLFRHRKTAGPQQSIHARLATAEFVKGVTRINGVADRHDVVVQPLGYLGIEGIASFRKGFKGVKF